MYASVSTIMPVINPADVSLLNKHPRRAGASVTASLRKNSSGSGIYSLSVPLLLLSALSRCPAGTAGGWLAFPSYFR